MFQLSKPLFLVCETPLHAGSGDSLGIVDLPIQRERHTSFPKIEASSLKGALREAFEEIANAEKELNKQNILDVNIHKVFGYDSAFENVFVRKDKLDDMPEGNEKENVKQLNTRIETIKGAFKDATDFAGAIGFTDARLLLFPIKSMKGVFAWITCPRVLRQFEKDINLAYQTIGQSFKIEQLDKLVNPKEGKCFILCEKDKSDLVSDLVINKTNNIVLEEYAFKSQAVPNQLKVNEASLQNWIAQNLFPTEGGKYWNDKAKTSIVILSDDDFKDFVNLSTEVITRTKIDNEKGTVVGGALFTEEYLPSESVLYSLILASPEFSNKSDKKTATEIMTFFEQIPKVVQIGGNATLGKGIMRTIF